jgi:hypothetical protein
MKNLYNSKFKKVANSVFKKISIAFFSAICGRLPCHHSHKLPIHMV